MPNSASASSHGAAFLKLPKSLLTTYQDTETASPVSAI